MKLHRLFRKILSGILLVSLAVTISLAPSGVSKVYAVDPTFNVLVVGQGGGGGANRGGGGGGARVIASSTVIMGIGTYAVDIGNTGGQGGVHNVGTGVGTQGATTTFSTGVPIVSVGGGPGGGSVGGDGTPAKGAHGGGGCAGGCGTGAGSVGIISNQGGNGETTGNNSPGGGGGGSGGSGGNFVTTTGGVGGACTSSSITGSAVNYGCGAGGGANLLFIAGAQGGDTAGISQNNDQAGGNATANSGSGGGAAGGANPTAPTSNAGNGGTGVVIIAYPTGTANVTGCNTTGTDGGGNSWCKFTTDGTFEITSFPSPTGPSTIGFFKFSRHR